MCILLCLLCMNSDSACMTVAVGLLAHLHWGLPAPTAVMQGSDQQSGIQYFVGVICRGAVGTE